MKELKRSVVEKKSRGGREKKEPEKLNRKPEFNKKNSRKLHQQELKGKAKLVTMLDGLLCKH